MKKKTAKIEFKLEEELLNRYKLHCEKNGLNMSGRLRLFIEHELLNINKINYPSND